MLEELGIKGDPLLDLAMELEKIALNDKYFVDRKLYPNVDFYSGIILKAMGFPTSMFTALFAVSRTVGWVSQWKEMMEDPQQRIGRPRQIYTGAPQRDYVPVCQARLNRTRHGGRPGTAASLALFATLAAVAVRFAQRRLRARPRGDGLG